MSPEEIGLVGCWQVIAVKRDRIPMNPAKPPGQPEVGYYVSSIALEALSDEEISQLIRDHWSAIENGVHYRRDVSFQEDQCRVKDRVGAEMLAVMRNLAVGLYELELERGRTQADSFRNWMKGQTFSNAPGCSGVERRRRSSRKRVEPVERGACQTPGKRHPLPDDAAPH